MIHWVYLVYTAYMLHVGHTPCIDRIFRVENLLLCTLGVYLSYNFGVYFGPYIIDDTLSILGVHGVYALYVRHTPCTCHDQFRDALKKSKTPSLKQKANKPTSKKVSTTCGRIMLWVVVVVVWGHVVSVR